MYCTCIHTHNRTSDRTMKSVPFFKESGVLQPMLSGSWAVLTSEGEFGVMLPGEGGFGVMLPGGGDFGVVLTGDGEFGVVLTGEVGSIVVPTAKGGS